MLRTIELAQARLDEYEASHPDPFVNLRELALRRVEPHELALRDHLRGLQPDDLKKLQAIMYGGRDDDDIRALVRYLGRIDKDPAITAHTVGSKLPLPEYLTNGLKVARAQRIDLEASASTWAAEDTLETSGGQPAHHDG